MATHQTNRPTTKTRATRRVTPRTSLTPRMATQVVPIVVVVAIITTALIADPQDLVLTRLLGKAGAVVEQRLLSSPTYLGLRRLGPEVGDLPQRRPVPILLRCRRQQQLRRRLSTQTTTRSARRKTCEWRMKERRKSRRCRRRRSLLPPLLRSRNPDSAFR